MKRTSSTQFDMMVTFMEEHGDLSKPSASARGRVQALTQWEELANLLNSDGTGDSKSVEKWKKVWSDFKNNTKRKAARLHKAARGTGGGPANLAQLTGLELRVLAIIGVQAATGLAGVVEAGLSQNLAIENVTVEVIEESSTPPRQPSDLPLSSPPLVVQAESPPTSHTPNTNGSTEIWNLPGPSRLPHVAPPQPQSNQSHRGAAYIDDVASTEAAACTPRPRRVMSAQPRTSPRRRARLTGSVDQAALNFLHSDSEWRKFKIEQHRAKLQLEKEKLRIRELELEVTRGWQVLGSRCLDILDKVASKYIKE